MQTHHTRTDWTFVGGITFAILSNVAFATFALYVFTRPL